MTEISTSLLNVEEEKPIRTFYNLETAKTDYFHIDVMDGEFVPTNTLERMKEYTSTIKQISNIPLDVHLMVNDIKKHIEEYIPFKPNIITFHIEPITCMGKTMEYINLLKHNNIKVGISVKPNTKLEEIYEYLPYIHMVLIMTVEPGFGGQKLIPETLEKVKELKKHIKHNNVELDIEVDGGINLDTAETAKNAGVDILVAGSAIINSENFKETIQKLKK